MDDAEPYYSKTMPESDFPVEITHRRLTEAGPLIGKHWHEHFQFFLFTEGDAAVSIGSERFIVGPGDLAIINSCEPHSAEAITAPMSCTVIRVDFSFLSCRITDGCQAKFIAPLENGRIVFRNIVRNDPVILSCIDELVSEYDVRAAGYELAVKGALYRLFALLVRSYTVKYLSQREQDAQKRTIGRLTKVFDYIDAHLADLIPLERLASIAGTTTWHFCRLFRAETGVSSVEYVNRCRVERAEQLLRETSRSVSDIASECGIPDANYFSRLFREFRGISPREVRKNR
jgi:AraC-like DNA-binding protein